MSKYMHGDGVIGSWGVGPAKGGKRTRPRQRQTKAKMSGCQNGQGKTRRKN